MIQYDAGQYSICFAFHCRGSVFPKACIPSALCAFVSVVLHRLFLWYPDLTILLACSEEETKVLSGFWFILGFLVVFRSQQSYARWVDGATFLNRLRAEWFNSYSSLMAFCNNDPKKQDEVSKFKHQVVRLFSLLHGCALHQVSHTEKVLFETLDVNGMDKERIQYLMSSPDRCEICLQWIQRLIIESEQKGTIKVAPPILSRVFNELGNGIANLATARKIKDYPIPYPLAQMMVLMLLFHAFVFPVLSAATVTSPVWCGVITFVVIFSYWSIHYIAVELEMPFGDDANDLPLVLMQQDMNRSLSALIDYRSQEVPKFNYSPNVHEPLDTKVKDFNRWSFVSHDSCLPCPEQCEADQGEAPLAVAAAAAASATLAATGAATAAAPPPAPPPAPAPEAKQVTPSIAAVETKQLPPQQNASDELIKSLSAMLQERAGQIVQQMQALQDRQMAALERILAEAAPKPMQGRALPGPDPPIPLAAGAGCCSYKAAGTQGYA
eukprot:TRINITY_DN62880_c0_g1_i1.p1 TRINITY_DN62880_c0_g1~~TRINITY_DN62880_c0_g1_i1.p1  ORF type:complete len:520 (+),score=87.75 TRINITY_DN62880_c0_g1_i1:75-1562(+)